MENYPNLKDFDGNDIFPAFYTIKPPIASLQEKLCVVYLEEGRFYSLSFPSGLGRIVVNKDIWNEEYEIDGRALKLINIFERFREATDLLDFINEGLEGIIHGKSRKNP